MANGYLCPKKNLKFQQFEVVSNRRDEFSQEETEELIKNAKIRYENTKPVSYTHLICPSFL